MRMEVRYSWHCKTLRGLKDEVSIMLLTRIIVHQLARETLAGKEAIYPDLHQLLVSAAFTSAVKITGKNPLLNVSDPNVFCTLEYSFF